MIKEAMYFAAKAHAGQCRKGTKIPYIVHPIEAANIVSSIKNDEKLITAALLHDTVEDCEGVTFELLESKFGKDIARIVMAETQDKNGTWEERKGNTIERLKNAEEAVKIVSLGDKLSNMRTIYNDYHQIGDEVWNKFHVKEKQKIGWYYKGLRNSLSSLSGTPVYEEYSSLVTEVFN